MYKNLIINTLNEYNFKARIIGELYTPHVSYICFKFENYKTKIKNVVECLNGILNLQAVEYSVNSILIPNKEVSPLLLTDNIPTDVLTDNNIYLGIDELNNDYYLDIAKFTHLLIIGASGGGKSNLLRIILKNLLFKKQLKKEIIILDTKRIEFKDYKDHANVFTDPFKCLQALKLICEIMDKRYAFLENGGKLDDLDYIFLIIDEWADLKLRYEEVELYLLKLAQLGRGAKIKLIVATQHAKADIINTKIKANFLNRICFKTADGQASRVAIDKRGAENLVIKGETLAISEASLEVKRVLIYLDE